MIKVDVDLKDILPIQTPYYGKHIPWSPVVLF